MLGTPAAAAEPKEANPKTSETPIREQQFGPSNVRRSDTPTRLRPGPFHAFKSSSPGLRQKGRPSSLGNRSFFGFRRRVWHYRRSPCTAVPKSHLTIQNAEKPSASWVLGHWGPTDAAVFWRTEPTASRPTQGTMGRCVAASDRKPRVNVADSPAGRNILRRPQQSASCRARKPVRGRVMGGARAGLQKAALDAVGRADTSVRGDQNPISHRAVPRPRTTGARSTQLHQMLARLAHRTQAVRPSVSVRGADTFARH